MNKKFYGTLLLGTLLLGSTIVSCKDYDDDIDNLQDQITQLATKADLESKVSALESSLSAAKASAESAVKTATQALADAKAAADKANSASDAAGAAQDSADKAAAAVKAAEEALAAAEKKVAAIEEQLAAVETLKADLQAYTEAEIKNLKTQIASDIDALKEEVQGLVGLHYVDLVMSNATPNADPVAVSSVKFTPKTNDKYYKIFKAKFPELADLEGTTVINTAQLNVLVSPADAEMKSEYTYELIDMNQEAVALEVANPVKGLTRASGSEYWSLEVAPTFDEKGKINNVAQKNYALRVSEGTEEIYKTAFEFKAQSGNVAENNLSVLDETTVAYAEEIDLVNDIIVDTSNPKDGIFDRSVIGITNGLKDYYIITIKDKDDNSFDLEKYGVSIDGSKLTIANMPANAEKFSIKYSVMALFSNGAVKRETDKTLTIVQNAETMATLESKQITLGDDKTYTLRYSVDSLGLTPSQLANLAGAEFSIKNDEGKVLGTAEKAKVSKTTTGDLDDLTNAAAKTAKYIGFKVNAEQLKSLVPGNYTVVLSKTVDNVVVYSAEGDLEAVNSGVVIKLIEALCDEDGVLQAVGELDDTDNSVVKYDVKRALIFKGAELIESAEGKPVMEDLDETVDNLSWVKNDDNGLATTTINVHVNDNAGNNHINNTVRNLRLYYTINGTSDANVEAFDFQVKMMSAVYSEDPTQVITVANKSIYFTPTKDVTPADNKFDLTSVVTKAVFACGNKAGQEYRLFQGFKTTAKADAVKLVDYTTPYTTEYVTFANATTDTENPINLLSDKDGNLKAISVNKLKEKELIDANEAFYAEATELYLTWDSKKLYYKYSKDGVVKIIESKATLSEDLQTLNNAWFDNNAYDIATTTKDQVKNALKNWQTGAAILKTGVVEITSESTTTTYDIYEWVFGETKNMSKKAKQFEALRGDLKFKDFADKYSAAPIDAAYVTPDTEKKPAKEIKSVAIKFNDQELAEKFVKTPTSWTDAVLKANQITVEARQDYDPSQLVDNQITLDATITIEDVWGMKMEVPFQVTCKVNPNN